jgi:mevalonate kinase
MTAISASAPGKIILFGEHAVVYSQPAIAFPIPQIRARVVLLADPHSPVGQIWIDAPAIRIDSPLTDLSLNHPLRLVIDNLKIIFGVSSFPAVRIQISSSIPIASGLGSGAAVSIALIRGFSSFLGQSLSNKQVSDIAFQAEKVYHGNPSGLDNTVITFEKPVYFIRDSEIIPLIIKDKIILVIADSGIKSETVTMVSGVRQRFQANPAQYQKFFDEIGSITMKARDIISKGPSNSLGPLMVANHKILQTMEVSSEKLDKMVDTALSAGALGAKLSGAGGGGNMVALVNAENAEKISSKLIQAGALQAITTTLYPEN